MHYVMHYVMHVEVVEGLRVEGCTGLMQEGLSSGGAAVRWGCGRVGLRLRSGGTLVLGW